MDPLKIMIVDDNEDLADGLAVVIEEEGYDVTTVYNGEEAIKKSLQQQFDVIFMDVKLPGIDGMKSAYEIRKKRPDSKIFLMTGYRIGQLLEKTVEEGNSLVLQEPYTTEELLSAVKSVGRDGILLVSDSGSDLANRLKALLEKNGYQVVSSGDYDDVVDQVVNKQTDVLILEMKEQVIRALDVYLDLKKRNCQVTTIIVADYDGNKQGSQNILKSTAITGCLFKPFDPEESLKILQNFQ